MVGSSWLRSHLACRGRWNERYNYSLRRALPIGSSKVMVLLGVELSDKSVDSNSDMLTTPTVFQRLDSIHEANFSSFLDGDLAHTFTVHNIESSRQGKKRRILEAR